MPEFVILTTADLPEAYFLAAFLMSRAQRFAMVNITARSVRSQLRVLARLRRNRGTLYLADLLLARASDGLASAIARRHGRPQPTAFPEVDRHLVQHVRTHYPRLDCADPHASEVLDFVRRLDPDYLLLAGAPILKPSVFELARRATLNRHLGLVPEFRGSDCPLWALALGRPDCLGYSIHVVGERVDAGDVIVRRPVPVGDERSLGGYLRRLQRVASLGFVEVIERVLQGAPLPRLSAAGSGRYCPPAGWWVRHRARRNFARTAASARAQPRQPVMST